MSSEFLDEIISMTRQAMNSSGYPQMQSGSRLPSTDATLYGADAGDDYARSVIDAVKTAMQSAAKCRQMEVSIVLPSAGKGAMGSMEKTFRELLDGFDVTVSSMELNANWKRHFNL